MGEEYTIIGIEGDDVLHNKVSTTINVIGDEAGALMTIFNFEDLPSVKDYKAIKNNFKANWETGYMFRTLISVTEKHWCQSKQLFLYL